MTFPRDLEDYTPPKRAAGAWTGVRVEESPGVRQPSEEWTENPGPIVVTPALPDVDPMAPATRVISFPGQLRHGWARVTWLDDAAGEGPTDPIPLDELSAGWLCSIDDVKRYLVTAGNLSQTVKVDDELLRQMIAAASDRMHSERPERTLAPNPLERDDPPVALTFSYARTIQVPDLRELVSLEVDGVARDVADVRLMRRPGEPGAVWVRFRNLDLDVYSFGDPLVAITGLWGPPTVQPRVREATIAWVGRVYHQRTARFADNAPTPDGGVLGYFRNLPPDVKVVLDALWIPGA